MGDRLAQLVAAYQSLQEILTEGAEISTLYLTAPVDFLSQPPYLNAVVVGQTTTPAPELLNELKELERKLGRTKFNTGMPREIDLDILLYGKEIWKIDPNIHIPHPRLHERWFALGPLVELWPDAWHPTLGQHVTSLLRNLSMPEGTVEVPVTWQRTAKNSF